MTPITSRVFRRVASAPHTQAAILRATVPSASITWIAASAGASEMSQYACGGGIQRMCQRRYVAQQATESNKIANLDRHAELVKETIKKMMSERHDDEDNNSNNQKPISDLELQGKFNYFKVRHGNEFLRLFFERIS
jgi:type IV pilus biogenesis protein CpaD/CtpE